MSYFFNKILQKIHQSYWKKVVIAVIHQILVMHSLPICGNLILYKIVNNKKGAFLKKRRRLTIASAALPTSGLKHCGSLWEWGNGDRFSSICFMTKMTFIHVVALKWFFNWHVTLGHFWRKLAIRFDTNPNFWHSQIKIFFL